MTGAFFCKVYITVIPPRFAETDEVAASVNGILTTLIETRAVEYKRSAPFSELEPHIVKTAMATANLRGGGFIIIGVSREDNRLVRTGMAPKDVETFDPDNVLASINKYASPAVSAILGMVEHHAKDYIVIAVSEFARTPVICHRDGEWAGKQRVFAGTIFVRPAGLSETRPPRTALELDEVLDMAAEKRALYIISMRNALNRADLGPSASSSTASLYDSELGGAADL